VLAQGLKQADAGGGGDVEAFQRVGYGDGGEEITAFLGKAVQAQQPGPRRSPQGRDAVGRLPVPD